VRGAGSNVSCGERAPFGSCLHRKEDRQHSSEGRDTQSRMNISTVAMASEKATTHPVGPSRRASQDPQNMVNVPGP